MDQDRPCSSTDSPWRLQECRLGDPPPFSCPIWKTCRLVLYTMKFILESILLSQAGVWAARKREWTSQELPSSLRDGNCEINTAASSSLPVVMLRCVHGSSRGSSGRWAPDAYGGNALTRVPFLFFSLFCLLLPVLPEIPSPTNTHPWTHIFVSGSAFGETNSQTSSLIFQGPIMGLSWCSNG